MEQAIDTLRLLALYFANGGLVMSYVLWENILLLVTIAGGILLLWHAPSAQRTWIGGTGLLCALAVYAAPPPVPIILCGMMIAGVVAVGLDRFGPDVLRWRIVGGLTLYAAGALIYLGYSHYLGGVDAAAWAEAIGGQDEAQITLAQGRAFLNTLATWGLWLILPLGYASLLAQGILAHPPAPGGPGETIAAVRTRGH